MYLMFIFFKMTPYYLDYFNILAGGAKGVYEKHLFELGWWGQGEKEASQYLIHHAPKHARIGYVLDPVGMMEFNKDLSYEQYNTNKKYDYVVVNYYALLKHDFNEKILTDDYKIIYSVFADGAPLVHVFQQKRKSISK